jgi:hypothetical protein
MYAAILYNNDQEAPVINDNYCGAAMKVSVCGKQVSEAVWGEQDGCVFRVGSEMYFVPTQQTAEDDMLYITCDAQKIEGPMDGWRSRLSLSDGAAEDVEDAIVDHLQTSRHTKGLGETFIVMRDGKTFRL